MKIKYVLAGILIVLSFYITDKSMIYIRSKNPIMQEIISKQDDYKVEAVNAIINDNTIIPGINGKEVDVNKTFNKMDDLGYFNDLYIIYSYSAPNLSLNDNKDKIIIKGNEQKNMVALIIDHNTEVSNYLDSVNIKYTNIVYLEDKINKEQIYINGESENKSFSNLNSILNNKKVNSKICLVNYSNLELCKKNKYYLVNYSINMNDNIFDNLNNISSGDIVLVSSNTTLTQLKLLINEITRLDLKIDYLNNLISEKN